MSTDTRLIVHFSCPQCATVYAASQEQRPGDTPATFIAVLLHSGPFVDRALQLLRLDAGEHGAQQKAYSPAALQ
jgi:hypothetical protein